MSEDNLEQEDSASEGRGGNFLAQLPSIIWQRRWWLFIPAIVGMLAATVLAFVLPTKYEASAVLLVQSKSLPEDVVGQAGNDLIDRRIEALRQQVISRPALVSLIERNSLYDKERQSESLSSLIEEMRESIALMPRESVLKSSRPDENTISLQLSFTYRDATKAQAVTQQLMEKILEINSISMAARMTQTVQFLSEQQAEVQKQIAAVEGQVADINARYGKVLSGAGGIAMIGAGSAGFDMQIAALERDNSMLQSQRETAATSDIRDPAVVGAEASLAALRAVYAETHPDVIIAKQRLEEAKQFAKQNVRRLPVENIDRQLAINNSQIAALRMAKAREAAQVSSTLSEKSQAPLIQEQVSQLQQRLEALYRQNEAVSNRLMSARAGARADEEQMGERLVVIDPPVVPEDPVSPNRPLIVAAGSAAGLALGFLLAMVVELLLRPIRDPAAITAITGAPPLALVPVVETRQGKLGFGARLAGSFRWPRRRRKNEAAADQDEEFGNEPDV